MHTHTYFCWDSLLHASFILEVAVRPEARMMSPALRWTSDLRAKISTRYTKEDLAPHVLHTAVMAGTPAISAPSMWTACSELLSFPVYIIFVPSYSYHVTCAPMIHSIKYVRSSS